MNKESSSEAMKAYLTRYNDAMEYARKQRGDEYVTKQKIAEAVGLTDHSTVSNWSKRGMPKKHVPKFADYMGVRHEWLLSNIGEMVNKLSPEVEEFARIYHGSSQETQAYIMKSIRLAGKSDE